jgi:hypothetical protein
MDRYQKHFRWGQWVERHSDPARHLDLIGFSHNSCGSLTTVENFEHDAGDVICGGCRFEIKHPQTECSPIWGLPQRAEVSP